MLVNTLSRSLRIILSGRQFPEEAVPKWPIFHLTDSLIEQYRQRNVSQSHPVADSRLPDGHW